MQSRIVLVSDDSDFFEYIVPKLFLRKYDELYRFGFADLPEKLHLLTNSVIIANSEEVQTQTLELLELVKEVPVIVFAASLNKKAIVFATSIGSVTPIYCFSLISRTSNVSGYRSI